MNNRPFDLAPIQQKDLHLVITSYTENNDPLLDRVNADAELDKRILITSAGYAAKNGGYRETSTTAGIVTVTEAAPVITITLAAKWEDAGPTKYILPVVYYKGKAVPYVGTGGSNGITAWDGLTAAKTITINNAAGRYSAVDPDTDWEVELLGDIVGQLESLDGPGVNLPYTINRFRSLGYKEPTVTQTTQDGEQSTGSFTFWEVVNAFKNGATIHNTPGEDLEKAIYGSQWSAGQQNQIGYNANPFAISVLSFSGNPLKSTTLAGQVFAIEERAYGCFINNKPAVANRSQGSTEPVKKQVDYTIKNGVYRKVHLITAP